MSVTGFLRGAAAALLLTCWAGSAAAQSQPAPRPARVLDIGAIHAAQPAKLAKAVAGLRPGVPGRTELFAVLAAWYPDQRVFLREVEQAAAILVDRFGAQGRTVLLATSMAEPQRHPLATPGNLAAATAAVAAAMNPEDVLLVYLTSHGQTGSLSAGDSPLRTPPLTAQTLDGVLDRAGAANTVAVISACRSGSFLPAVSARDRLVITAASAERNSFGCSDANEWTWFGKAFFDEGLRQTRSLSDAFARAAALIAGWEAAEGEIPSQPQIAKGAGIAAALEKLARDAGG